MKKIYSYVFVLCIFSFSQFACNYIPAPNNLQAKVISSSQIALSWNDNSDNEDGFKIERSEDRDTLNFIEIATVNANVTSFNDTKLIPNTIYHYRIHAYKSDIYSMYSNIITIKTVIITWEKFYDSGKLFSIQQTNDKGYIAAGIKFYGELFVSDMYILKLDAYGNKIWDKTYGNEGMDNACSIIQTTDGGYIVAGSSYTDNSIQDMRILKLDVNGNIVWDKYFGTGCSDGANAIIQTTDGGFIVAGYIKPFETNISNMWIIKLNQYGDILWNRTYGGSSDEGAASIQQTTDGGYILAGYTKSYGAGSSDIWIIKLDQYGNETWNKTYGGSSDEEATSIQQTTDGGFIVAGYTKSYGAGSSDIWIIKLDQYGNTLWNRTYGESSNDEAASIKQTTDEGYIVAGKSSSYGAGGDDMWILKLDQYGNKTWDITYGKYFQDGAQSIQQTIDGGYVIAGYNNFYITEPGSMWVLKLDENGKYY